MKNNTWWILLLLVLGFSLTGNTGNSTSNGDGGLINADALDQITKWLESQFSNLLPCPTCQAPPRCDLLGLLMKTNDNTFRAILARFESNRGESLKAAMARIGGFSIIEKQSFCYLTPVDYYQQVLARIEQLGL